MADISKVVLPSGSEYNIADSQARQDIANIQAAIAGGVHFIGTTTSNISDGSTTNPIVISGSNVTAKKGDLVVHGDKEFVWDGSKWLEFGDLGALGALAFKDSATGTFKPAGTVSKPTFTGSEMTATGKFTPAGSVAAPTISVKTAGSTTTIKNPTSQTVAKKVETAAPGATAPANVVTYCSVANETLSLYQIGYTTGASITTSNVTVKNGDAAYQATAPAFTGTEGDVSVKGTPAGTVSQPTFTGTSGNVTVS